MFQAGPICVQSLDRPGCPLKAELIIVNITPMRNHLVTRVFGRFVVPAFSL